MQKFGLGMAVVASLAGCAGELRTGGNIGGANANLKMPGNVPGGIAVRSGDIAISPRNSFYVTLKDGTLVLGDMQKKDASALKDVPRPDRLAFWGGEKDGFVVLSQDRDITGAAKGRQTVLSYDRSGSTVVWKKTFDRSDRRLDVTADGRRVILTGNDVLLLDAATGDEAGRYSTDVAIRDVDLIAGGRRMVVIEDTRWVGTDPLVRMSVRNTDDGSEVCHTETANCADDATVSEDESRVFLAPTLCQKDPISVMKVQGDSCSTETQMAGFGPVAMSPSGGNLVVGFLDRDAQEPNGATVPAEVKSSRQRYHLMLIDQHTLEFTTVPVGNELPRYAFTPDGKRLLVDTPMDLFSNIRILDIESRTFTTVDGPPVKLNAFTMKNDSLRAYVADGQLFDLNIAKARIRPAGVGLPPDGINISVDGATLLVTQVTDRVLMFLDAGSVREEKRVYY